MKKILFSILFLSVVSFSCDSEDDGITYTTPDYLSGRWNFSKIGTINNQNFVIYQNYINETTCEADNLVLRPDNTFALSDFTTVLVGTTPTCESDVINGQFIRQNRNLILIYRQNQIDYEITYTINALTYNEITLSTVNNIGETIFYKLTR